MTTEPTDASPASASPGSALPVTAPPAQSRKLLLAVDAPSLLHRNHHARAESALLDQGGRPAWALHGMLRQILEAIDQFAPDAVVFGLDDRRDSVRERMYPAYKAGRAAKDATLVDQLERAAALLDALGLQTVTPAGLEADDVSASAAVWAETHGWECVIITSDRDSFAHISEHTRVLRLINGGINASPLLNPARLFALYGIAAEHYLEYAALRGDASDNLPGVPGIGEKTAPVLLSQMGSMRSVWADIEHCDGANLVAALDSYCEETGQRRIGAGLLKRLTAPGARERFDFNLAIMSGRPVDLGLTPDAPGTPGLLPLDPDRVSRVVGYLGVPATTQLALRVLTEPPGSRLAAPTWG
ncbi:5'-3' exonuclease [Nocardioides sp. Leaf307]|uniref:5'-3' exonuclease n=1 Tax=Nocardioides sp. Leaf307 TaxID=1736331 RepID=UPI0009EB3474|nr:5'-3' exonuclease H3TH domain-containing protein [Nocardioides sp. Leaf307]